MKRNFPAFEEENDSGRIIDQLISKITKGEFQVEGVDISRDSARMSAKVNVKIKGSLISGFRPESSGESTDQRSTDNDPSLSADEKQVQKQVANCYL